jgi:hypothetical protein
MPSDLNRASFFGEIIHFRCDYLTGCFVTIRQIYSQLRN